MENLHKYGKIIKETFVGTNSVYTSIKLRDILEKN